MDDIRNGRPRNYRPPRSNLERKLVMRLFMLALSKIDLSISFDNDSIDNGTPKTQYVFSPPPLFISIRMLLLPDYWVGASYVRGHWYLKKGDLTDFIADLLKNTPKKYLSYFRWISKVRQPIFRIQRFFSGSNRNTEVAQHYQIDTALYRSFLDEEMLYTCAFFLNDDDSLEEAQQRKMAVTVERLKIPNQDARILDIGSGWGAFERYLTKMNPKWTVTGISLSNSQIEWAREHDQSVLRQDQFNRIQYINDSFQNYSKTCPGIYDAILIVGMIEHVGSDKYSNFVDCISNTLKAGGRCIVHTIVSPKSAVPTNRWIDVNIFPNGYAPSISELVSAFEVDQLLIEDIFVHSAVNYFRTIDFWKCRFAASVENGVHRNEDEEPLRIWYFYLSSVQNMFRDDVLKHQVVQIVVRKL